MRLNRVQLDALEAVRRAATAPLDSIRLREEVHARTRRALPSDFSAMATSDSEVGVFAHGLTWDYPEAPLARFYAYVYPHEAAMTFIDLARSGSLASTQCGPIERDYLVTHHMGDKLRVAFADQGRMWGGWCLARTRGTGSFDEADHELARTLAPIVGGGLRRAALLEAAAAADADASPPATAPGVAIYDAGGSLVLRDARAARYIADLDAPGRATELPVPVAGALTELRWRMRRPAGAAYLAEGEHGVRVRGRSGQWYAVHASEAEAQDPASAGQAVVVLTPLSGGERASILARLHGLTPREREVTLRIARGESGKQIAAALGLSAHTVQAHIDNACAKMGVRGRRELVARLFVDASAARMAS